MANVKLVIEIDEEWLKDIKERIDNGCVDHEPWVAIANGKLLPKTGRWIEHFDESGKWYECDQCHTDWGGPVNYCPNCGADMGESEDNKHDDNN